MSRRRILSLFWHNIYPDTAPDSDRANPTASDFRRQLRYVLDRYSPISLDEFLALQHGSEPRRRGKPPVLLGFDDGFRNVVRIGLPILREFDAPAVLFTLGEVVENPEFVPWYMERKFVLQAATRERVRFLDHDYERAHPETYGRLRKAVYDGVKICRSEEERQTLMADFADSLGVPRPSGSSLPDTDRFLDLKDLAELDESAGLAIGSHAMTHWPLATLNAEQQPSELERSHEVLSQATACYRPVVSYPDGSFNQTTIDIAANRYRMGFAVNSGSGYGKRFAYPRVAISASAEHIAQLISPFYIRVKLPLKRILRDSGFLQR